MKKYILKFYKSLWNGIVLGIGLFYFSTANIDFTNKDHQNRLLNFVWIVGLIASFFGTASLLINKKSSE